jgi:hypothetical protein
LALDEGYWAGITLYPPTKATPDRAAEWWSCTTRADSGQLLSVEMRRPEQMRKWADAAGLREFEVFGQGALSADDEKVGQGVWLLFEKKPPAAVEPSN